MPYTKQIAIFCRGLFSLSNHPIRNNGSRRLISLIAIVLGLHLILLYLGSTNQVMWRDPVFAAAAQSASIPVAAWGFNEGSGGTTNDASGNGNTGTLLGGASWLIPGRFGNAITFNGTNSAVKIPDNASWRVSGLSGYTVSLWIRINNPADNYKAAIGTGSWPANDLYIYKNGGIWEFGIKTSGTWSCGGTTSTLGYLTSADGNYHHIALVLNSSAGRCEFYSDGNLVGLDSYVNGTTSFGSTAAVRDLFIGGLNGGQYLNAAIDEVRVYTSALTQAEIVTDSNTPIGGGSPTDTVPPVISGVAAGNITASSAVISWLTDEPADSRVEYGLTQSYGQTTALDTAKVTSHSQIISALSPNTLYHYRVHSRDVAGNPALSADFTFTTNPPAPDTTPPVISGVASGNVTSSTAPIYWTTDEPASSRVEYGPTTSYGYFSPVDPSLVTDHNVLLSGLAPNMLYHYRVHSIDASGNSAVSADYAFTTQPENAGFQQVTIAGGLSVPTSMAFSPDGRIFVTEKNGNLRIIQNGQLLATPFHSFTVASNGEQGLLGIAFDPNFPVNQYIYVYYTVMTPSVHNRLSRLTASGNNSVSGSEVVLLDLPPLGGNYNHQGGAIHFGADGKLYIAVGDHQDPARAQLLDNPFGKMLRLNPDGTIPSDNPFIGQTTGINQAIYAIGFRNPYTFAVDPVTGRIFVNDVGNATWEEINQLSPGANYGWPTCEGPRDVGLGSCNNPDFTYPLHSYDHSANGGGAITGGAFYRGNRFPAQYAGDYFFSDYTQNWIRFLDSSNQVQGINNPFTAFRNASVPIDLDVGPDGSLYYLSIGAGALYRIEYASGNLNPTAVISASPTSGQSPLLVNFDGGGSGDPDGDPITFQWDFGDGSASASGSVVSHTYNAGGAFTATLTVSDNRGGVSVSSVNITVGTPPAASIDLPLLNAQYKGGDTIFYQGSAVDSEDGVLPASGYSWTVVFHHDAHTHPFLGPINGVTGGSFQIPQVGETSPNVWYRVHLTVTDSSGLQHSVFRDIFPTIVNITLEANYPGLTLTLDGQPVAAPVTFQAVAGIDRSIGLTSPQTVGGIQYSFVSWSDGGAQTHTITTPSTDSTYTAVFQQVTIVPVTTDWVFPNSQAADTSSGDRNGFEISAANMLANDGQYATDRNSGTNQNNSCTNSGKDRHVVRDFNISLPAGKQTVNGIEVRLDGYADNAGRSPRFCVQLSWNGGGSWTSPQQTPVLTTSEQTYILGGVNDLWGRGAWIPSELSKSNFQLRIVSVANSTSRDFFLDTVGVRLTAQ